MKTRAEIDKLILDWREDPCWELEETEGFEDHKDELLAVRMKCEAEWKARADKEHAAAISALIKPAHNFLSLIDTVPLLGVRSQHAGGVGASMSSGGLELLLTAIAEMLLPLQKQIDRLEARQESAERELDRQVDNLRKRIEALS